ncbi:hypothetical protein ACFU5O_24350 [Streptomyces sp. NPDC057445]|uniref:hypothetical protein n=1 Tax=Streptomyces sp. NPDC057445 TaxID=3346136 RepID=UPI0036BE16A9
MSRYAFLAAPSAVADAPKAAEFLPVAALDAAATAATVAAVAAIAAPAAFDGARS